jgi:hypothetical protein
LREKDVLEAKEKLPISPANLPQPLAPHPAVQPVVLLDDVNEALIEEVSAAQPAVSVVQVEGNRSRKIDVVGEAYQSFGAKGRDHITSAQIDGALNVLRRE